MAGESQLEVTSDFSLRTLRERGTYQRTVNASELCTKALSE